MVKIYSDNYDESDDRGDSDQSLHPICFFWFDDLAGFTAIMYFFSMLKPPNNPSFSDT